MTVTPSDIDACIVWLIVAINFGPELTREQILARQDLVFEQDRRIVESQRPYPLPLELTAEFHVRSDRYSVEYRKWIKRLGSPSEASMGAKTAPQGTGALQQPAADAYADKADPMPA
jgi:phenylpropionate dioxygenase-like ring-hydroxylating dioxygenase large terminal subunit